MPRKRSNSFPKSVTEYKQEAKANQLTAYEECLRLYDPNDCAICAKTKALFRIEFITRDLRDFNSILGRNNPSRYLYYRGMYARPYQLIDLESEEWRTAVADYSSGEKAT